MRVISTSAVFVVAAVSLSCSHSSKLEELRKDAKGVSGSGSSGMGDSGQGGGGGSAGTSSEPACLPCPAPPELESLELAVEGCCAGPREETCGLRFEGADRCYPRDVPGAEGMGCPEVMRLGQVVPGCCRPDGQCGLALGPLGVGCVARPDLPDALGARLEALPCEIPCADDRDCEPLGPRIICTEVERGVRRCVQGCKADAECADNRVCALRNNEAEDRVDVYCQEPLGPAQLDDFCSSASQCTHGVCARTVDERQFCSRPCRTSVDCFDGKPACLPSPIPNPSQTALQEIAICTGVD